jgi:hypothetical protein
MVMNGWLLLRIAGIVVGIATLLRVATNEGIVTYDPLFLSWMDWLSDVVELGIPLDKLQILLQLGIEWVRSFGISVPDLQDEWRPAFVFSTLMFGAMARNSRSRGWLFAAPVGALVIAVWCGQTGSLAPVAVAAAFTAAFAAAFAVTKAVAVAVGEVAFAVAAAAVLAVAAAAAVLAVAVAAAAADLAVAVGEVAFAVAAVTFLFAGIVEGWDGGLRGILANANFNIGIDILGVMLGALGLASLFANPPIW